MKNFLSSIVFLFVGSLLIFSCQSEDQDLIDPGKNLNTIESKFKDLGFHILTENRNNDSFKILLYKEVEKQFDGDYNVLIETLLNDSDVFSLDISSSSNRVNFEMQDEGIYPHVFIPFYEELKSKGVLGTKDPIVVFHNSDESIREYPGFILNQNNDLEELNFLISEEFAMENEIWVIGPNERVGNDNFISLEKEDEGKDLKVSVYGNGALYVGSIMVPDLGAIESWVQGKVELELRAFSPNISNLLSYSYPQIKRDDLKNQKWKAVNTFICNWTSVVGDYIILHWTEDDGGSSSTPVTINYPATETSPAMTFTFTIQSDDDDLGYAAVLKTDQPNNIPYIGTLYNTGLIQWKMIN